MEFLAWLENTGIANAIRTIPWLYPTFETGHYIGLSLLVGGIMLIDLRVLGFARGLPLKSMIGLLPFVWVGFIINVFTGSMLFIYGATNFGTNGAFLLKMGFMVLAGLNALAFDVSVRRSGGAWVAADRPPALVKGFATLSLVFWLCVVTTGRWMAYL
jgi:energy-coupling factor transporter transmembrane protein EcfT